MGVMMRRGVTRTSFFIRADRKPLPSAQPTPSMVTSTTPSGAKPVKLLTRLVSMVTSPSRLSRLTAVTVCSVSSPVAGSIISPVTETPAQEQMAEVTINARVR